MTVSAQPEQCPAYTEHDVWDDESGERCFIAGHVRPERRAIAAANHWARDCGLVNLFDDKSEAANWREWITVDYRWLRPDPVTVTVPDLDGGTTSYVDDERAAWCDGSHPEAQPVTVVSW